ncbi:MAG: hypothetical protein ACOYJ2_00740 [Rickettsiales bacterium]
MSIQPYEIEEVVRVSVHQTLQHLGFTVDDPNAIQKDMIYLRMSRVGREETAKWIKRSAIGVFITGIL